MATLTVVDNADGTGATATIAGSSGGANVVYVGRVVGTVGNMAVLTSAARTGDGAVTLALAKGLYFAWLVTDGALQAVYYFGATDGLNAVATRCRRAVCDTIRLLNIPPAARVYEQAYPDEVNVKYPCILVTVEGVGETADQGLSTRDDIGRPVRVGIADRWDRREHTKLPDWEYWRQCIDRCFREQQLAGVPESKICHIEPYVIIDPNMSQYEHMVSGLVVRAVCREPRGVGA